MAERNDFKAKTRGSWPDGDMAESEVYEAHKKVRQAGSGLSDAATTQVLLLLFR